MFEDIQLENLEALLSEIETAPSASTIHGFFTSIHIVKKKIDINEIFTYLLEQEETVEDGEGRDELLNLFLELSNHIKEELETEAYTPLLEIDDNENVISESWAIGFYIGIDYSGTNAWDPVLSLPDDADLYIDLQTIIAVAEGALKGVDDEEFAEACREHVIEDCADIALDLFEYYKDI